MRAYSTTVPWNAAAAWTRSSQYRCRSVMTGVLTPIASNLNEDKAGRLSVGPEDRRLR
jgi:hypothetical protein